MGKIELRYLGVIRTPHLELEHTPVQQTGEQL